MDPITRDSSIRELKEQLELYPVQSASLENDADRRSELTETCYAIQLLLDFLQRKEGLQLRHGSGAVTVWTSFSLRFG